METGNEDSDEPEIDDENDEKDPADRVEEDEELSRPSPSKEVRKQSNSLGPPKIRRFITKKIEEEPI